VSCVALGLGMLPAVVFLPLGAIASTRNPRKGRWLMWTGALVLSLSTLPIGVPALWFALRRHDNPTMSVLLFLTILLVLGTDTALLVEGLSGTKSYPQDSSPGARS